MVGVEHPFCPFFMLAKARYSWVSKGQGLLPSTFINLTSPIHIGMKPTHFSWAKRRMVCVESPFGPLFMSAKDRYSSVGYRYGRIHSIYINPTSSIHIEMKPTNFTWAKRRMVGVESPFGCFTYGVKALEAGLGYWYGPVRSI